MENVISRSAAAALVLTGLLSATGAHAAGVAAGTIVQNTATATYSSGADSRTISSNTVNLRVDELLDVAVASLDATPLSIGAGTAVLSYSVTNTGNGPEAFRLTADPAISGNGFNAVVQSVVVDSNNNGVYDPGVDTVVANGGNSPVIAADGSLKVFVVVSLPTGAADAATSKVRLTAAAVTGTGSPGTTFAGQGEGGGDAVVGTTTGQKDSLGTLVSSVGAVALLKSFSVADQFGGTQPVPGAVVTYTIRASVSGTGQVTGLRVTDAIPSGTTYVAGTLTLDGSALTDATDGDVGSASASGIAVDLGSLNGGVSRTITFKTRIN